METHGSDCPHAPCDGQRVDTINAASGMASVPISSSPRFYDTQENAVNTAWKGRSTPAGGVAGA